MDTSIMDLVMIVIAIITIIGSFLFILHLIFKYSKIRKSIETIKDVKVDLFKSLEESIKKNFFLIVLGVCLYFGVLYIAIGTVEIIHILPIAVCWVGISLIYYLKREVTAYVCKDGLLIQGFLYSWKEFKDVKIEKNYIMLTTSIQRIAIKREKDIEKILKNYLNRWKR